jgi:hypothetical protein
MKMANLSQTMEAMAMLGPVDPELWKSSEGEPPCTGCHGQNCHADGEE